MLAAVCAAVLLVSPEALRVDGGSKEGLIAKEERVRNQIETLKAKIEGLKDGDDAVSQNGDIDFKRKQDADTCEDGEVQVCECVPSPPPPSKVTVGGDPIFTVGDKRNTTHVWLPFGEMTKLLEWSIPDGKTMQLMGKTFHQVDGYDEHVTENEVRLAFTPWAMEAATPLSPALSESRLTLPRPCALTVRPSPPLPALPAPYPALARPCSGLANSSSSTVIRQCSTSQPTRRTSGI